MHFRTIGFKRNPKCPACGTRKLTVLIDYDEYCGVASAPPRGPIGVRQLSPLLLASRRAAGDQHEVMDAREPWEWDAVRIQGARLIPLGTFVSAARTIDRSCEIVLYCHPGVRSLTAASYLATHGFPRAWNLAGGIDRYSVDVAPHVSRY